MAKQNKAKSKNTKHIVMTVILLLSTSILLTFLSMLIASRGVKFILDYYLQFTVSTLFVFALFCGIAYSVKSAIRNKYLIGKYVTIAITAVFTAIIISEVLSVFVDKMALILIFPALLLGVLMDKKVAKNANIMTSLVYLVLLLLESIVLDSKIEASSIISTLLSLLSGFLMISLIGKNYTRYKMVFGSIMYALIIALASIPLSLLYTFDWQELLFNGVWVLTGQMIAIAIYALVLPIYENLFEVCTDFKLAELSSFSQPLLMRLKQEAPGTFNHSLMVGNLAENCALAIGENPFLARVSAYYHDVGKLKNPIMFIENQNGDYNPHDELIPEVSAKMITRHARAGYEMLKEYHMPEEIARIALEHHGTSSVMFFYMKAQKITEGKLSMSKYRYDGPKPTTKISAIIMICDTVEAAVRSRPQSTDEELRAFVKKMIKDKMDINQFDDCDITFQDLKIIEDEIVNSIPRIFHKRIDYSKEKK